MTELGIHQRRYLGSKRQLLPFIQDVVARHVGDFSSFADLFAGTGVVAHAMTRPGRRGVVNELLHANWCALDAFLGPEPLDRPAFAELLDELRAVARRGRDSYLEEAYGGRYLGVTDAGRVGAVRQRIEDLGVSGRLRSALVAALLYSVDRVAHTCGHYDAFRGAGLEDGVFELLGLSLPPDEVTAGNIVVEGDANYSARRFEVDVVYLDPPYNSRQYADAYHVLENVARWERPELHGKARKFDRRELKSRYNVMAAADAFDDLVASLRCRHIIVSYSTMRDKGDPRSRNRIDDGRLEAALRRRGTVEVHECPFRAFSAGRGTVADHAERLFVCRVTAPPTGGGS